MTLDAFSSILCCMFYPIQLICMSCSVELFVVHLEFSNRIDVDELEWLKGVNNDCICKVKQIELQQK